MSSRYLLRSVEAPLLGKRVAPKIVTGNSCGCPKLLRRVALSHPARYESQSPHPFMSWRSSFGSSFDWLSALLRNPYFWGGLSGIFVLLFGLFLVFDGIIMPSYTRHDASVRVPDVEQQPFETAKATMKEKGLDVRQEVGRYNPNVDRDVVVDQTPLPDATVKPGRRVYLTVNAGDIPMVKIPDLKGRSVREARNRISAIGLEVDTVRADSIPSPYANTITRQSPAPGDSIERGASVELWYSTGLADTTVAVPDVVGASVSNAQDTLLAHKLRFVVVDTSAADSDDRPDDDTEEDRRSRLFVREQGRAPGTEVLAGTEVRLFVTDDSTLVAPPAADSDTTDVP